MNVRSLSYALIAAALSASASAAILKPKAISQPAPAFAADLRASGVEGDVVVAFTITPSGDVRNPVVVTSTNRLLDKVTVAAVRKWKFAPPMADGVAVSMSALQPVAFRIAELHPEETTRLLVSTPRSAPQATRSTSAN